MLSHYWWMKPQKCNQRAAAALGREMRLCPHRNRQGNPWKTIPLWVSYQYAIHYLTAFRLCSSVMLQNLINWTSSRRFFSATSWVSTHLCLSCTSHTFFWQILIILPCRALGLPANCYPAFWHQSQGCKNPTFTLALQKQTISIPKSVELFRGL